MILSRKTRSLLLHPKKETTEKVRDYLVNQVLEGSTEQQKDLSELLLVMHDSGMLESEFDAMSGEPLFMMREDIDEQTEEAAYAIYESLPLLDEASYFSYVLGEKH